MRLVAAAAIEGSLRERIQGLKIRSIAIPALGAGNGGLDWRKVKPVIEGALGDLPDVEVLIFEPLEPIKESRKEAHPSLRFSR